MLRGAITHICGVCGTFLFDPSGFDNLFVTCKCYNSLVHLQDIKLFSGVVDRELSVFHY